MHVADSDCASAIGMSQHKMRGFVGHKAHQPLLRQLVEIRAKIQNAEDDCIRPAWEDWGKAVRVPGRPCVTASSRPCARATRRESAQPHRVERVLRQAEEVTGLVDQRDPDLLAKLIHVTRHPLEVPAEEDDLGELRRSAQR
jgi:hypothetical protein